ncbi:MAG: phosphoserine phosphatase SerB [Alphaproteobacteria bacterium]|nr:phosphoserine phosphatase SerB [Alphaproteobacteria bacterium]
MILSLIAPAGALDPVAVASIAQRGPLGAARWLSPGEACDVAIRGSEVEARAAVAAALDADRIDVNVLPAAGRRKRLLVADMESTLIENEMIDELAETIGIGEEVREITWRAMNGELDFRDALRERVALLAGLPVDRLEDVAARIRLMPGAPTLVATMRAHGAFTAIVSGGFLVFTRLVRRWLGTDYDEGNDLEIAAGALTGEVREPVLNRDGKVDALRRLSARLGIGVDAAIAVGDGANDVPMLQTAGMGVAFRAKPAVAAEARLRIAHGDLTALLFLQGYERAAFVTPEPAGRPAAT